MACFEYKCDRCNQVTEKLEHYSAPTVRDCDVCGSKDSAHRILSQSSFSLDGSGWYKQSYSKAKG